MCRQATAAPARYAASRPLISHRCSQCSWPISSNSARRAPASNRSGRGSQPPSPNRRPTKSFAPRRTSSTFSSRNVAYRGCSPASTSRTSRRIAGKPSAILPATARGSADRSSTKTSSTSLRSRRSGDPAKRPPFLVEPALSVSGHPLPRQGPAKRDTGVAKHLRCAPVTSVASRECVARATPGIRAKVLREPAAGTVGWSEGVRWAKAQPRCYSLRFRQRCRPPRASGSRARCSSGQPSGPDPAHYWTPGC